MTRGPWVVDDDAPLRQARSVMVDREVHHLPVVRGGVLAARFRARLIPATNSTLELGLIGTTGATAQAVGAYFQVTPGGVLQREVLHDPPHQRHRPSALASCCRMAETVQP